MKLKNNLWPVVAASLIIGIGISVWSYYFVEYIYGHGPLYGLIAGCPDRPGDSSCMPLTDYTSSGFPVQFTKTDWSYELNDKPFDENTIIYTENSFSWPLFLTNSLIWALPVFLVLAVIKKWASKKR